MSFEIFLMLLMAACLIGIAWNSWCLRCVGVAGDQRQQIINWVFDSPDWRSRIDVYRSVEFDSHLEAVEWFRDPWDLYPPEVSEAKSFPSTPRSNVASVIKERA